MVGDGWSVRRGLRGCLEIMIETFVGANSFALGATFGRMNSPLHVFQTASKVITQLHLTGPTLLTILDSAIDHGLDLIGESLASSQLATLQGLTDERPFPSVSPRRLIALSVPGTEASSSKGIHRDLACVLDSLRRGQERNRERIHLNCCGTTRGSVW